MYKKCPEPLELSRSTLSILRKPSVTELIASAVFYEN